MRTSARRAARSGPHNYPQSALALRTRTARRRRATGGAGSGGRRTTYGPIWMHPGHQRLDRECRTKAPIYGYNQAP
eukprot:9841316-Alexandrium_andersonii.AAC.1